MGGFKLPKRNVLLAIGPQHQKVEFQLFATKGTHELLKATPGLEDTTFVYKPLVKREPNVSTLLQGGKIDLVINVPDSMDSQALTDGFELRRMAVDSATPLITDIKTATLCVQSLHRKWDREKNGREFWSFASWQEYVEGLETPL